MNYNKLSAAVQNVRGLNNAQANKKASVFDWFDVEEIRKIDTFKVSIG